MDDTPLKWAGILREPPISVPVPNIQPRDPTRLPVPLLEPPGESFGFVALVVVPKTGLSLPYLNLDFKEYIFQGNFSFAIEN
jgi:hypothetical protein